MLVACRLAGLPALETELCRGQSSGGRGQPSRRRARCPKFDGFLAGAVAAGGPQAAFMLLRVSPMAHPLGVTQNSTKASHSGVYSCLTCAPASIATNSACASAISGISGVGEKPSSAGARTAWASARRLVD